MAQLGRAFLASLLAPAFGTGAAVSRPLLWAPLNVRSDGALQLSLAYTRILSLSSARRRPPFAKAKDAAGATFLLAARQSNLPEILAVKNSGS